MVEVAHGIQFAGVQSKAEAPFREGQARLAPPSADRAFRVPQGAIRKRRRQDDDPEPVDAALSRRPQHDRPDGSIRRMEEFYRDLGQAYKQAIQGFYAAGCRYLQLDDCSFAYLCDPAAAPMLAERGDDPDKQGEIYAGMINATLDGRPKDLVVTTHVCRGNFRSTFIASGGYEPIADLLFNGVNVDGYFLEWDNDRAGGFEPLRFCPRARRSCSASSPRKPGRSKTKTCCKRRIERSRRNTRRSTSSASPPQCGFASHRGRQCAGGGRAMGASCGWSSKSPKTCGGAERAAQRLSIRQCPDPHTGTWSDGLSQERTWRSMPASVSRSAACGDSSRWSMRMPSSLAQAPAW